RRLVRLAQNLDHLFFSESCLPHRLLASLAGAIFSTFSRSENRRAGHIHLDIETDDLDAEVARLEALGATRIAFVKRWWVMQAPTGHRFCVVRKQREEFASHLNEWP
uniref:VOC family protein n=1 Tax=Rudaea sp. TaxID=2136325 RepID=UPI0037841EF3